MIKLIKAIIAEAKKQHGKDNTIVTNSISGVKVSRNSPCACGSNKKYKKCCGKIKDK